MVGGAHGWRQGGQYEEGVSGCLGKVVRLEQEAEVDVSVSQSYGRPGGEREQAARVFGLPGLVGNVGGDAEASSFRHQRSRTWRCNREDAPLKWIVINSPERSSVRKPRRFGVTVPMLKWIGQQFEEGAKAQGELKVNCRVMVASLLTAWYISLVLHARGKGVLRQQWG